MKTLPDFPAFRTAYATGRPQVVWTTMVADLETPVSAMLKLAEGRPNSFLLESVDGGAIWNAVPAKRKGRSNRVRSPAK